MDATQRIANLVAARFEDMDTIPVSEDRITVAASVPAVMILMANLLDDIQTILDDEGIVPEV